LLENTNGLRKSYSEILIEDLLLTFWRDQIVDTSWGMEPAEQIPTDHQLEWKTWRTLNRMRVDVGRSKYNMSRWGYLNDSNTKRRCGQEQIIAHLLVCPRSPNKCSEDDLIQTNETAVEVARFWTTEEI
jgi:hypothetical protein